jgi:glycosyltransferase involved in cell wall biosynthesis
MTRPGAPARGGYSLPRVTGVSLVIPLRDEATSLAALIASIDTQRRPPDEVILIDGGSTDGTLNLARQLLSGRKTMQVIEAGPATPGRGRNVGRSAAQQPWIAFTDAGIELDPSWLEKLVEAAEHHPDVQVVYGTYEPVVRSFLDSCALGAYVSPRHSHHAGMVRGPSVASMMIRSVTFDDVGGFPDLRAAEDLIFFDRLDRHGDQVAWAPDAIANWHLPPSITATFRRFRLYSLHNVLAGRQRNWHYGVARLYAGALVVVTAGVVLDRRAFAALPVGVLVRSALNLGRHRQERGLVFAVNPVRIAGVAGLIVLIDIATFTGWIDAWRATRRTRVNAASSCPGSGPAPRRYPGTRLRTG